MGNNIQKSVRESGGECVKKYLDWTREEANELIKKYKDMDMEFGLDRDSLPQLIEVEDAKAILLAFDRGRECVNALEFLMSVAFLAQGSEEEVFRSIFNLFDFNQNGRISFDEMTIAALVFVRSLRICSRCGSEPSEIEVENLVKKLVGENTQEMIDFAAFSDAAGKLVGPAETRDVSSAFGVFGIEPTRMPDPAPMEETEAVEEEKPSVDEKLSAEANPAGKENAKGSTQTEPEPKSKPEGEENDASAKAAEEEKEGEQQQEQEKDMATVPATTDAPKESATTDDAPVSNE